MQADGNNRATSIFSGAYRLIREGAAAFTSILPSKPWGKHNIRVDNTRNNTVIFTEEESAFKSLKSEIDHLKRKEHSTQAMPIVGLYIIEDNNSSKSEEISEIDAHTLHSILSEFYRKRGEFADYFESIRTEDLPVVGSIIDQPGDSKESIISRINNMLESSDKMITELSKDNGLIEFLRIELDKVVGNKDGDREREFSEAVLKAAAEIKNVHATIANLEEANKVLEEVKLAIDNPEFSKEENSVTELGKEIHGGYLGLQDVLLKAKNFKFDREALLRADLDGVSKTYRQVIDITDELEAAKSHYTKLLLAPESVNISKEFRVKLELLRGNVRRAAKIIKSTEEAYFHEPDYLDYSVPENLERKGPPDVRKDGRRDLRKKRRSSV